MNCKDSGKPHGDSTETIAKQIAKRVSLIPTIKCWHVIDDQDDVVVKAFQSEKEAKDWILETQSNPEIFHVEESTDSISIIIVGLVTEALEKISRLGIVVGE